MKRLLPALVLVLVLATGCGGDDEDENGDTQATAPTTQQDTGESTGTGEETPTATTDETTGGTPSPEDEEGGAGDEEPIRSEAVFTCDGNGATPDRVEVPAFIAIKVRLEGSGCTLTIEGRTLQPGDSVDLDGIPPQERYTGRAGGTRVEVVPTAEPGP